MKRLLFLHFLLFASLKAGQVWAQFNEFFGLFQNRFFTVSQGPELLCTTSDSGFLNETKLREVIAFYEHDNPSLREAAVNFLTRHTNKDHLNEIQHIRQQCAKDNHDPFCVLENYWNDKEAALRVLALFYDTKTVVKHNNNYNIPRFEVDHIRSFEKAIRKIPTFMRSFITHAKPIKNLHSVFEQYKIPADTQELILDAFPEDNDTRVWLDGTQPLGFVPGVGFRHQVVAQVYSGTNNIIFTIKNFDKAKEGHSYRDIGLTYLVDFRLPLIIHEIGHVVDNFHFWDGKEDLYYFFWYRKMSTDIVYFHMIKDSELALWPSRWFNAFEYLWEINNGRYNGKVNEKLAELFAQYILIPQKVKDHSPDAYAWLRDEIFKGMEYSGYEKCHNPVVRKLTWWEDATAHALGK